MYTTIKGCKHCGIFYMIQKINCKFCWKELDIYDLPVNDGVPE